MDSNDKSSWASLPGGSFIVVALLTAGILVVSNRPLESSRPLQPAQRAEHHASAQDIDARLWQDPLGAIAKARELTAKPRGASVEQAGATDEEARRHSKEAFAAQLQRQSAAAGAKGMDGTDGTDGKDGTDGTAGTAGTGHVAVLAVMALGGPYAERVESRLRLRYAVLAGLATRGLAPADNEHLGYVLTPNERDAAAPLPPVVPFERFDIAPDRRQGCKTCRVFVLWLDSNDFSERPLQKLGRLAAELSPAAAGGAGRVRWRVLGPASSDVLQAMVDEVQDKNFDARPLQAVDLRLLSGAATVDDQVLLQGKAPAGTTVAQWLDRHHVQLLRTIGNDDALARQLTEELGKRGLHSGIAQPQWTRRLAMGLQRATGHDVGDSDRCGVLANQTAVAWTGLQLPPSSIAVVSEWDTLYGRSLVEGLRYDPKTKTGFCLTRWNYMRGLDGRLPGDDAAQPSADAGRGKRDNKASAGNASPGDSSYIERPEGQSQFDYLRRLARRMQEKDIELRRLHGNDGGIRAIGVLGNDVYDKLLVLQALQPAMPHAIFFTTDIDARLFHPSEQAWARNLIVASNFGLQLNDALQRDSAPFRDSYQTSAYLSTMLAIAGLDNGGGASATAKAAASAATTAPGNVASWFNEPRIFEVSRSGLFNYSAPAATAGTADGRRQHTGSGQRCDPEHLDGCSSIHPPPSDMVPATTLSARFLVAAPLLLALWAPLLLNRDRRRRLRRYVSAGAHQQPQGTRLLVAIAAAAALTLGLPLLLSLLWPGIAAAITQDGKPLSWTEGISPWPTYIIRLLTFVLCLYLMVRAWTLMGANIDRIARAFHLGKARNVLVEMVDRQPAQTGWRALWPLFSVRFYREPPRKLGDAADLSPSARRFWGHYLLQNRPGARLLRTTVWVLLMVLLSLLVSGALGDRPDAPSRDQLTRTTQWVSELLSGIAALFLIFFVVDATLLCVFFVRGLRLHASNWPDRTVRVFSTATGVPGKYLEDWIDMTFVARRTEVIGALVYYPFVVLSLLLLARSSFFDDWYTPPSTIVLAALSFAIVLGCALALRRMAEATRTLGVARLNDAILRAARVAGQERLSAQLEQLRARMERLSTGAFAPYSKQPLLRAVLLPLLTVSGTSLLDYLSLMGL